MLHEGEVGQSFQTSVGVRQGCLLSPVLFNLYLENIMQEALHKISGTISINGREISNLRFTDDIDLITGTEEELQEITTTLERRVPAYRIEISAEKSKVMVNSRIAPRSTILMNGESLEEVKSFKYLGSTISSEGNSREEICKRINLATSAIAKLKKIWSSNDNIKTATNIVQQKLNKEKAKHRIAGPFVSDPFPNMVYSPLGPVPKKEQGEFRLIHDLSFPKPTRLTLTFCPNSLRLLSKC